MNHHRTLGVFVSGIVVYAAVAACSASSSSKLAGGGGDAGFAGTVARDAEALLDAFTAPIRDANAGTDDGGGGSTVTTQSGTRLKVQYYAAADGSRQAAGMFDSLLNVECSFGKASDGQIRCLPIPASTVTIGTQTYFADASCSQALGVSPYGTCSQPTVIAVSVTTGCTTTTTNYQVGSQFTGQMYQSSSSGCTAVSSALQTALAGFTFYTLGAEIPPPDPSQYVAATLQMAP